MSESIRAATPLPPLPGPAEAPAPTTPGVACALDRNGLASLDDLGGPRWEQLFRLLERHQEQFLAKAEQFRSPDYPWPHDALHSWSRVWEYPYVYHHLERLAVARRPGARLRVMDLGCGVTAFPFAVSELGYQVICTDVDPIVGRDLRRAAEAHGVERSRLIFRLTDGRELPADDDSLDAVYSISVLEHIPEPLGLIAEVARVLRPGGRFILTLDLSVGGREARIGPEGHRVLREALEQHFLPVFPERSIHPRRMLTSDRGPYPVRSRWLMPARARRLAQAALRELFGIDRTKQLACEAFVLKKP